MNKILFEISSLVLEQIKFVSQGPKFEENIVSKLKNGPRSHPRGLHPETVLDLG